MKRMLKRYEDVLFDEAGKELLSLDDLRKLADSDDPLTLDELREMKWEPAWVAGDGEAKLETNGWAILWYCESEKYLCVWWPGEKYADIPSLDNYGDTWSAYRHKPEALS